jgi:selenocysteine lyase/cysteine desulfurase
LYTSTQPAYSCALATFGIAGKEPVSICNYLFNKYRIHTTPIERDSVQGVRVTPHVYTTLKDLDRLVKAIQELAA